ncbi:conserved hypothetical protein [Xenorhabdus bovienii SS-2004]|uniref:Uncharacterized protein n=1 Tax=Xenorhabdus bovienii (strain SS-2004) TaxID=406818 RepID=D3V144_XENBS|nr:conserved hypothetical protein [Xenorhabdus bovienii SS-2004]
MDVAGTQTKITEMILAKLADYLLAVKENQPSLSAEVTTQFQTFWHNTPEDIVGLGFYEEFDTQYGSKDHRSLIRASCERKGI